MYSCHCKAILSLLDEATTWSEKEAQMRVLLDAKGHRIEELQYALNDLKESSEREIRIMKHQLLMTTGLSSYLTVEAILNAYVTLLVCNSSVSLTVTYI